MATAQWRRRSHALSVSRDHIVNEVGVFTGTEAQFPQAAVSLAKDAHLSSSHFGARWFAVFTSSHHEKRVLEHLRERQIESFLPLYRTVRRRANRCKVALELPLFPNYLFVQIERSQRTGVLAVPGILSIVGAGREPAPLPDCEIEALRSGLPLRSVEPHPYLTVGERARIKAGALAGWEGVLLRKKNDLRVVLTLDQIMRSVAVEVDADDLEPVRPRQARDAMN